MSQQYSTENISSGKKDKKLSDVRLAGKLYRFNKLPTALFAICYTLVSVAASTAVVYYGFYLAMKVCGLEYVGNGTILQLLSNPLAWIILLISAVLLTFIVVVEVGGLITDFGLGLLGIKAKFWDIVQGGLQTASRVGEPQNFLMLPFVLLLIPFTGVMAITNAGMTIGIPGFINDFIMNNVTLAILTVIVMLILTILASTYIFALSVFTMEGENFLPSCKKSRKLMKGNFWRFFIKLGICNLILLFWVLLSLLIFCGIAFIVVFRFYNGQTQQTVMFERAIKIAALLAIFLCNFISPVLNMAYLTAMHVRYEEEKELLPEADPALVFEKPLSSKEKVWIGLVCAILLISGLSVRNLDSYFNNSISSRPMIVAHRGDSLQAPENSYPAFQLAIAECVSDGVELDVHQTKDGVVVVSHDDYLERISGEKVYVHELTYEELQKLDVGSWFSEDFKGLKMATLKEVLELCKDMVDVQVEIKPTKYDQDLEQKVLDIIKEVGSENETIILSLKSEPLITARELDPDASVMACMYLAQGPIEKIPFANALSLEESLITWDLVNRIHKEGKRVFVWTINSEDNLQYLVDCGVDGILTDNPVKMDEWLDKVDYSGGFLKLFRTLLPNFE